MEVVEDKKEVSNLRVHFCMAVYNNNPYHPCGC